VGGRRTATALMIPFRGSQIVTGSDPGGAAGPSSTRARLRRDDSQGPEGGFGEGDGRLDAARRSSDLSPKYPGNPLKRLLVRGARPRARGQIASRSMTCAGMDVRPPTHTRSDGHPLPAAAPAWVMSPRALGALPRRTPSPNGYEAGAHGPVLVRPQRPGGPPFTQETAVELSSGPGWSSRPRRLEGIDPAGSSDEYVDRMPVYEGSIRGKTCWPAVRACRTGVITRGRRPAAPRCPRQRRIAPRRLLRPRARWPTSWRARSSQAAPSVAGQRASLDVLLRDGTTARFGAGAGGGGEASA